jgi:hypothetical protein
LFGGKNDRPHGGLLQFLRGLAARMIARMAGFYSSCVALRQE